MFWAVFMALFFDCALKLVLERSNHRGSAIEALGCAFLGDKLGGGCKLVLGLRRGAREAGN